MKDELFLRVSNLTATVLTTPQGEKSVIFTIIVNETKLKPYIIILLGLKGPFTHGLVEREIEKRERDREEIDSSEILSSSLSLIIL